MKRFEAVHCGIEPEHARDVAELRERLVSEGFTFLDIERAWRQFSLSQGPITWVRYTEKNFDAFVEWGRGECE